MIKPFTFASLSLKMSFEFAAGFLYRRMWSRLRNIKLFETQHIDFVDCMTIWMLRTHKDIVTKCTWKASVGQDLGIDHSVFQRFK